MTPVDWDAETYDRVAAPQEEWGRAVLDRLELSGDETVLDAGCGSGRVTALLLERLPRGRVIGMDASAAMIDEARGRFEGDDRVELRVGDLLELDLDEEVDVVFSTATFHWILEHVLLFTRIRAALRPGGRLVAQCGGEGNIAEIVRVLDSLGGDERFSPYLRGELRAWNFAGVADTESKLRRVGLEPEGVWLQDWPVRPREPEAFLRSAILQWHFDRLPSELHEAFVDAVLESMPRPLTFDYVRLNIDALRPE